jgi:hypothetical protein
MQANPQEQGLCDEDAGDEESDVVSEDEEPPELEADSDEEFERERNTLLYRSTAQGEQARGEQAREEQAREEQAREEQARGNKVQEKQAQEKQAQEEKITGRCTIGVDDSSGMAYGAEFAAARVAVEYIIGMRLLMRGLGIPEDGPTILLGDNRGVVESASNFTTVLIKKHNAISYHRVREAVAAGIVDFRWLDGDNNLADLMTKPVTKATQTKFVTLFMYGQRNC